MYELVLNEDGTDCKRRYKKEKKTFNKMLEKYKNSPKTPKFEDKKRSLK